MLPNISLTAPRISQRALFVAFLFLLAIAEFVIPGGLTPRREKVKIISRRVAEQLDVFSATDPYNPISGPFHIQHIHKKGLVHRGVWIFALDSHLRLLLAWRSPSMHTCPNTWSILGEHVITNETYRETAIRGLTEEARFIARPRIFPIGAPFFYKYIYPANQTTNLQIDNQWTRAYVILPRGDALDFRSLDDAEAQAVQSYGENLRYQGMSIPQVLRHTVENPAYFCNDIQAKWMQRTIPLVIRVLKTKERRLFRAHLKHDWAQLVKTSAPVCCLASEHDVDVQKVDFTACGVPCQNGTIHTSDIEVPS